MGKRVFSRVRSPRKRSSEFSSVSDGGMFESRPFVAQSKVGEEGEKSIQQSSDLKTQLSRATRFGHNLSQMPAVQSKAPIRLENHAIQQQVEEKQPEQMKSEQSIQFSPEPDSEKAKGEDYANNVGKLITDIGDKITGFTNFAEITTAIKIIDEEREKAARPTQEVSGEDINQKEYGEYVKNINDLLNENLTILHPFSSSSENQEQDKTTYNSKRKILVSTLNSLFDDLPTKAVDQRVKEAINNITNDKIKRDSLEAMKKLDAALRSLAGAMKHQLDVLLPVM